MSAAPQRGRRRWKAEVPVSGPANPPSGGVTPESPKPILSGQIKVEATSAGEKERGEATLSDQIKANGNWRCRKGKIARLPEEIRQALNERLENGEEGKALLEWLNGLPEVRGILASEYE